MKKIKSILIMLCLGVAVTGCNKNQCNCPQDETPTTEEYKTIINDYSELYKKTTQSVVMLRIQRKSDGKISATGSGVVVFEDSSSSALIYTNAHVVEKLPDNNYEVEVFFSDENGYPSGESEIAEFCGKSAEEDVAVLRISKSDKYKLATLGNSSVLEKGDWVYTIGSPLERFNYTTSGNISNTNVSVLIDGDGDSYPSNIHFIAFDAVINAGNSGGALFNDKGELVGITSFRLKDKEGKEAYGMNAALPINHVLTVAKNLIKGIGYQRPTLNLKGIKSINTMSHKYREAYGIVDAIKSGVFVEICEEEALNSTGYFIIKEVNNKEVKSIEEYEWELMKSEVGKNVVLTLMNVDGTNIRTLPVVLR